MKFAGKLLTTPTGKLEATLKADKQRYIRNRTDQWKARITDLICQNQSKEALLG